jgi:hypothetical protein
MSEFDDNLWQEIVREHEQDLADASAAAARRSRRARPRLLAGTSLGLAGVGVVLALVLSAASSSPAFAVTRNHDGTVSVKVFRVAGIAAANAKLAALGIRARIVPQTDGCLPLVEAARGTQTTSAGVGLQAASGVQFDPRGIPAGRTLVIAAGNAGGKVEINVVNAVRGAAPACMPPPITAVQQQSFLANAQCMREHGVPNLPNPTFPPGGGVAFNVPYGSLAYEGAAILQSSKACNNVGTPLPLRAVAGPVCPQQPLGGGNSGYSGTTGSSRNSGTMPTGSSGKTGSLQAAGGPGGRGGKGCGMPNGGIKVGPSSANSGNSGNS